jgi:SAM-dependent methyltransferase
MNRKPAKTGLDLEHYLRGPVTVSGNEGYPPLPPLSGLAHALVPEAVAPALRRMLTDLLRPWARRRAVALRGRCPLLLHLGSGRFPKDGWVNIDLVGVPVDLPWNLARGIPFPTARADAVFHEHLLEHLSVAAGYRLLRECARVLKPGGVLRVGVPDVGAYLRSYAGMSDFIARLRPGRPTALLAVQEVFYRHGHRSAYDLETLQLLCHGAGFVRVEHRPFGQSRLRPAPDSPHRRAETLYVEAVKP